MTFKKIFKKQYLSIYDNIGLMILMFIGPIFLTVVFGGVYVHNYINDMPLAVLDEDQSTISRMITESFMQSSRFDITNYPASKAELQALVDDGKVAIGIYMPKDLERDVMTFKGSEVLAIMDGSNNVVAGNAYAEAMTIVQTINAGVEMKLIQGKGASPETAKNIALVYNVGDRVLYDSKMTYMNYLMICFLAIFIQQLFLSSMSSMLIRNQDYLSKGNVKQNVLGTMAAAMAGLAPSSIVSLLFLKYVYHIDMVGNTMIFWLLTVIFLFAITGPACVIASFTKDRVKFSQISFMLSVPVFVTSGIVWPFDQMPWALEWLIKSLWPMAGYAKMGQEVLIKGRELYTLVPSIMTMAIYGVIWFLLGTYCYKKAFAPGEDLVKVIE